MAEGPTIGDAELPEYLLTGEETVDAEKAGAGLEQLLADYERAILQKHLADERHSKDKAAIASELQISLSTLYRKMEKYGLEL
ncbi:helix-turn-helix domain-containing protein, partial [Acinetobacter baumannii]